MELDPIEIRLGNYFDYRRTVKEITLADLAQLETLLPELNPILITPLYLTRLNFGTVTDNESVRHFQKYTAGIYFNLYPKKNGSITLYINQDIKLPHIKAIHQLQNVYYELTGDVLKRQPPSTRYEPPAQEKTIYVPWERRSGPGKYRTPKC
jgi:hypothetical protein